MMIGCELRWWSRLVSYRPSLCGGMNIPGRRGSGHHPVNSVLLLSLSVCLECPVKLKNGVRWEGIVTSFVTRTSGWSGVIWCESWSWRVRRPRLSWFVGGGASYIMMWRVLWSCVLLYMVCIIGRRSLKDPLASTPATVLRAVPVASFGMLRSLVGS